MSAPWRVGDPLFILAVTLATIGILLSLSTLAFNICCRHNRLIKMSSPNLNAVINLGTLVAYVTIVLFSFGGEEVPWATLFCQVRVWLLPLSFSLVFGPLFAKSWRVRRIFRQSPAKRVVIRDIRLMLVVIVLLMVDAIVLSLWYSLDPISSVTMSRREDIIDPTSGLVISSTTTTSTQCWSLYSTVWTSGLVAVKVCTLLYGLYLAWAVRGVTLPTMNESPCIAASSLVAVLLASLQQMLSVWLADHMTALNACAVVIIWIVTTVTLTSLYVPKIYYWWKNTDDDVMKLSFATSQTLCSPGQDRAEEALYKLTTQPGRNKPMKKRDAQPDSLILTHRHENGTGECDDKKGQDDQLKDSGLDVESSSASVQEGDVTNDINSDVIRPRAASYTRYSGLSNEAIRSAWATRVQPSAVEQLPYMQRHAAMNVARYLQDDDDVTTDHGPQRRHYRPYPRRSKGRKLSVGDIEVEVNPSHPVSQPTLPMRSNERLRVLEHPSMHSKIAGSIVQSLDLDDDSDTYSYISHRLSMPTRGFYDNTGYNSDQDSTAPPGSDMSSSRESLSTIGNDSYYPQFSKLYNYHLQNMMQRQSRQHRSHSDSHANSLGYNDSRANIYMIPVAAPKLFNVPSADGETLHGTDGTVV